MLRGGELTDLTCHVRRAVPLLGAAQGGGSAQAHVELEVRVAEGRRQRGELGQALHPIGRPAEHVEGLVPRHEELDALLRRGRGGKRDVHDPEDLFGGVGPQRVSARLDRELHTDGPVPCGLRVVGEH